MTPDDVTSAFDHWEKRDQNQVSLLCHFIQRRPAPNQSFHLDFMEMNFAEATVGPFNLVGAGSGFSEFVETLKQIDLDFDDADPVPITLEKLGLYLVSFLMSAEVFTGAPLRAAWGGLYEATIIDHNMQYRQIDSVTWLYFLARRPPVEKEYLISLVTKITALRYFEGIPVYIDAVFHVSPELKVRFQRVSAFGFSGFYNEKLPADLISLLGKPISEIDFNSKTLCLSMASVERSGGLGVLIKHDSASQLPYYIGFTDHAFRFSIKNELKKELFDTFRRNLNEPISDDLGIENFPI